MAIFRKGRSGPVRRGVVGFWLQLETNPTPEAEVTRVKNGKF